MITTTWNWLWEKHDQVKDMFRFFMKPGRIMEQKKWNTPDDANGGSNGNEDNNGNGDKEKRSYSPAQLIGLVAGPLLFLIILLFVSPEGLSGEGQAVLASTIWIAVWWMTEAIPIPATAYCRLFYFL